MKLLLSARYVCGILFLSNISSSNGAFSVTNWLERTKESVSSFFYPRLAHEVVQKEIPHTGQRRLFIENFYSGSIKIKTDWDQNSISLRATKESHAEDLAKISVVIDTNAPDSIKIKTVMTDKNVTGSVDYLLIIPKGMIVRLYTNDGAIKVKHCEGNIDTETVTGSITISQVRGNVSASIKERGTIKIDQVSGSAKLITQNGDIQIRHGKDSIAATALSGTINAELSIVPPMSKIHVRSSGKIEMCMPEKTNAKIRAQANHGIIQSEHYITLAAHTTKLNNKVWERLQKNVEGTIGTGEADMYLQSERGNITLLVS